MAESNKRRRTDLVQENAAQGRMEESSATETETAHENVSTWAHTFFSTGPTALSPAADQPDLNFVIIAEEAVGSASDEECSNVDSGWRHGRRIVTRRVKN